jgi:hypothetical protein
MDISSIASPHEIDVASIGALTGTCATGDFYKRITWQGKQPGEAVRQTSPTPPVVSM